jgi:DNA-binding GntR family transcriptional regulator
VLEIAGRRYRVADLAGAAGPLLAVLPYVLRILLENALRNSPGDASDTALAALRGWLETGTSTAEIAFTPSRVLMHDTTCMPALVDIAGMRDALAEAGHDPPRIGRLPCGRRGVRGRTEGLEVLRMGMGSPAERPINGKREMTEGLAARILDHVRAAGLAPGTHLTAQELAALFSVSRFPVGQALHLLASKGVVTHERNRGYFVSSAPAASPESLGLSTEDDASDAYFRIAEDHLGGRLPDPASEAFLRKRYGLTKAQLSAVLGRIVQEGWVERRTGYGWSFSPMLTTPESLEQTYRVRLALEPAALLEPTYRLDAETAARCRAAETRLLAGAIETDSADALHERGVRFHETIIGASGNPFFLETVRRINRVRRLLSYRSMVDRKRYRQQCEEHLEILDLLENDKNREASRALRRHLEHTVANLKEIRNVLEH